MRSINRTVTVSLASLLILIISGVIGFFYYFIITNHEDELDRYINGQPQKLVSLISYPLWNYDLDGVRRICDKIEGDHRIESLVLEDHLGERICAFDKGRGGDLVSVSLAVLYDEDDIGELHLVFTRQELSELRRTLLLFAIFVMIFTSVITFFILRAIFRNLILNPFSRLNAVLDSIKSGEYIWQYKGNVYKEIRPFIDELKILSLKLYENEKNVRNYTGEMEATNNSLLEEINLRKNAQEKLRLSEERYKLALEFSNDGIWDWNLVSGEIYFSPVCKKLLGYEDGELPNDFSIWEDLTHKDDAARAWEMQKALVSGERDELNVEIRMKHKMGYWVTILSRARVVIDGDGRALRMVGTNQDISQRKKYENELKLKNAAIDHSLNGFDIVDENKKLLYVNKSFARMFGYEDPEQMVGLDTSPLWKDPSVPDRIIGELKKTGEFIFEHDAKRRDGTYFTILMYARLTHDQEGREIYARTCIDISEIRKLEQELIQAHKMEAIGTLAGGIAHDFNNILSSIIGYSDLALTCVERDSESGKELNEFLGEVYTAGLRAKDLVKQILAFARKSDEELKPIQPMPIVKEIVKFLRASIPANIEIKQNIASESYIMGNPTQLHQILLNLCTNASDSMASDGGVMTISLENCQIGAGGFLIAGLEEGDYVRIDVSDTGPGIPRDIRDKIFQPYFTTKGMGQGTGMGLALVHGIVEKYKGTIVLESEEGKGTVFSIFLPVTLISPREEVNLFDPLPTGSERILFVDDEEALARLADVNLSHLGYRVTVKSDSREALDLFAGDPHGFDLVITDMTMPRLTGDKLSREIKKIRDDIPIILCTGYSNQIREDQKDELGISLLLNKPLTKRELAENIRVVLDGKEDSRREE